MLITPWFTFSVIVCPMSLCHYDFMLIYYNIHANYMPVTYQNYDCFKYDVHVPPASTRINAHDTCEDTSLMLRLISNWLYFGVGKLQNSRTVSGQIRTRSLFLRIVILRHLNFPAYHLNLLVGRGCPTALTARRSWWGSSTLKLRQNKHWPAYVKRFIFQFLNWTIDYLKAKLKVWQVQEEPPIIPR